MKKITLLFAFLCFSLLANAQATCNQTFTVSGQDDGPTVLTINAADLNCNGANAITSLQLTNSADTLIQDFVLQMVQVGMVLIYLLMEPHLCRFVMEK